MNREKPIHGRGFYKKEGIQLSSNGRGHACGLAPYFSLTWGPFDLMCSPPQSFLALMSEGGIKREATQGTKPWGCHSLLVSSLITHKLARDVYITNINKGY